jgi:hypothetical protein
MLVFGLSVEGSDHTWKSPLRVLTEVMGAINLRGARLHAAERG